MGEGRGRGRDDDVHLARGRLSAASTKSWRGVAFWSDPGPMRDGGDLSSELDMVGDRKALVRSGEESNGMFEDERGGGRQSVDGVSSVFLDEPRRRTTLTLDPHVVHRIEATWALRVLTCEEGKKLPSKSTSANRQSETSPGQRARPARRASALKRQKAIRPRCSRHAAWGVCWRESRRRALRWLEGRRRVSEFGDPPSS